MRAALVVLAGCGGAGGSGRWPVDAFLATDVVHLAHTPYGDPYGELIWLETTPDEWAILKGEDRTEAPVTERLPISSGDGLVVDGELLLPGVIVVGQDGVLSVGEHETRYGTFPRAVTVEIRAGRWAGTQVFAEELGPVTYTLDGELRDLVFYEKGRD